MSGLLNGENQWEIVQHFTQPDQAKMLDALVNGASALSLHFKNELSHEEVIELFNKIDLTLIHLYLSGDISTIKEVLKLGVNATIPLSLLNNHSQPKAFYLVYDFDNVSFIQEAIECLSAWKSLIEANENVEDKVCISFKLDDGYIANICKLRAIRNLWGLLLKSFDLEDQPLKILAKQKPYDLSKSLEENFIKASLNLTSASIASADAILLYEPESSLKSIEFRERITRNLHHLAAEEGNLDLVNDPLSGSYVIEEKTNELAKEAWNKFIQ